MHKHDVIHKTKVGLHHAYCNATGTGPNHSHR